jgi:hypothetical protein
MRRLLLLIALLALLATAATASAGAAAVPPFPNLSGAWTHVDINVQIKGKPHTLTLDRGRITQVSGTQLTLLERDRSVVVIPLSQLAIVKIDGFGATIHALRRGMNAQTMRIDGGPAVRIRAVT